MKLRNTAAILTHLVFVLFIALALGKYAQEMGTSAGDAAQMTPAEGAISPRDTTAAMTSHLPLAPAVATGSEGARPEPADVPVRTSPVGPAEQAVAPRPAGRSPQVMPEQTGTPLSGPEAGADAAPSGEITMPPRPERSRLGSRRDRLLARLVAAYPDFLAGYEGNELIWHDGTRMPFDDGKPKSFEERLSSPDIEDQFYVEYPRGLKGVPPLENIDPGRVRYEPLFTKMYGDCRKNKSAVKPKLVDVVWLPNTWGKTVKVTSVNGVAEALKQVSAELDRLPRRFVKYLKPLAGTYHCRTIAGTGRLSFHAFGAAIDINAKYGDYWRWNGNKGSGNLVHRNRIPWEIIEIFERHGFIWGGKWYHYDTLHFEYRPELLNRGTVPVAQIKTPPRSPASGIPQCLQSCRSSHRRCQAACDTQACRRNCDLERSFCESHCRSGGTPRP